MNRKFLGIWIPANIWTNKDISIQARCLYAEIQSLHDDEVGGCYASDKYLMEFMQVKRSRLQEILKELRDKKLLEVVSNNGIRRVMRVLPMPDPVRDPGKGVSGKADRGCLESRTGGTHSPYNIYNKEDSKEESIGGKPPSAAPPPPRAAPSPSSVSQKKTEPPTVKRCEHVSTSDAEHAKLVEAHGEEFVRRCYLRLSEWKMDTPKSKWKKSDYRSILRWVVDAIREADKRKDSIQGKSGTGESSPRNQLKNSRGGKFYADKVKDRIIRVNIDENTK